MSNIQCKVILSSLQESFDVYDDCEEEYFEFSPLSLHLLCLKTSWCQSHRAEKDQPMSTQIRVIVLKNGIMKQRLCNKRDKNTIRLYFTVFVIISKYFIIDLIISSYYWLFYSWASFTTFWCVLLNSSDVLLSQLLDLLSYYLLYLRKAF